MAGKNKVLIKPHSVVIAKRLRLQRVELFARLSQAEKALRAMLGAFAKSITDRVISRGDSLAGLKPINQTVHDQVVLLRMSMKVWMNALIRDAVKMGIRHPGDALKPVFRHNQEMLADIISEQALWEARLSFGMDSGFANRTDPNVKVSSAKWTAISQQVIRNIAKKNLQGLTVSERIWDLTSRTEADLKRIIGNAIGQGLSPYKIAKSVEKYVSPSVGQADDLGIQSGPGVYRSPYRNAMRLARTETNRAYTQATAKFAENKPWVIGMQVTLSPEHDQFDECDDLANGDVLTPDEFASTIPAHPHCMCYGTYVIDPQYLGDETVPEEDTSNE
jgi:hypothetical protein